MSYDPLLSRQMSQNQQIEKGCWRRFLTFSSLPLSNSGIPEEGSRIVQLIMQHLIDPCSWSPDFIGSWFELVI